jgi:hypothetical protein
MRRFVAITVLACIALPAVVGRAGAREQDKDVLGVWKLEFTTPDNVDRNPTIVVGRQYEKYVAWYMSDHGAEPFKDVRLEGDALVGKIVPKEQSDVTVTLRAELKEENQCAGTGSYVDQYGDSGSWNFTGQRLSPSDFGEVTTWNLSFVSPDGQQHRPTVTVLSTGADYYAWYSGKDHELPAGKLRVDGDRVEMKISAETAEGEKVDVTFRGTVDGDKIAGTAEYNAQGETGEFSFTGTRKS